MIGKSKKRLLGFEVVNELGEAPTHQTLLVIISNYRSRVYEWYKIVFSPNTTVLSTTQHSTGIAPHYTVDYPYSRVLKLLFSIYPQKIKVLIYCIT